MLYKRIAPEELIINERELAARVGDPKITLESFSGLYQELLSVANPAYVAERVEILKKNGEVSLGGMTYPSKSLLQFVLNEKYCYLLAATLGAGVDRLIQKRAHLSCTDAFLLDALADALIESLCDRAEYELFGRPAKRFSPGYADLELTAGNDILRLTGAEKMLGIKLTKTGLMTPKKSVNAIVVQDRKGDV